MHKGSYIGYREYVGGIEGFCWGYIGNILGL